MNDDFKPWERVLEQVMVRFKEKSLIDNHNNEKKVVKKIRNQEKPKKVLKVL